MIDNDIEAPFLKIINKHLKTNFKTIKQLQMLKEDNLNEDFKHFLQFWKGESYPAVSIFPTLQIWFELDNLLSGANIMDLDWKRIAIYGLLWVIIISGQHMILFNKWKKETTANYKRC